MTEGKRQGAEGPENSAEADIVDAEIIPDDLEGEKTRGPVSPDAPANKPMQPPAAARASKAGWISAGLLAAFVGGMFATPYFETGMISLGLRSARTLDTRQQIPASTDLAPLNSEISNLKAAEARYKEILAQFEARAVAQAAEIAAIKRDVELLGNAGTNNTGEPSASPAALVKLNSELAQLRNDFARLSVLNTEGDPAVSRLSGALALSRAETAQLQARLAAVETSLQQVAAGALEASPRGRLVLALSRMKDRAMAGLAFTAEVSGLRADLAELPALDQQLMGAEIAVLNRSGDSIRPYASLVRDYDDAVSAALRAGEKAEGRFLQSLFTSRRTDGGAVGNDAVFLQAERRLLARDVAGAVEALAALEGAPKDAIQPWRSAAETYVAVNNAFDRLIKAAANAGTARPKAPVQSTVGPFVPPTTGGAQ